MSSKFIIRSLFFHLNCIILSIIIFYPVLWMIFGGFKSQADIFNNILKIIPEKWIFSNFSQGWKGFGGITFSAFFRNSLIISGFASIGTVISSAIVGFGFIRIKFKFRKFLFAVMMITMMLPYQLIMVPQYVIFHKLKWINTFLPLIVPQVLGVPFFIFLVVQFIRGIPIELDESATIDGCNYYSIFLYIILPLLKSPLITVAIFQFYWRWEDLLQPLIYLSNPKFYPVSVALNLFSDPTTGTEWGPLLAMGTLSILPVVFVFFILQRYIVEGISTQGLKG